MSPRAVACAGNRVRNGLISGHSVRSSWSLAQSINIQQSDLLPL